MKLQISLTPSTKFNFKWIKNLNVRPNTLNIIEDKVGNILELIGTAKDILNRIPIVQALSLTTDKRDLMKLKSFCTAMDTIIQSFIQVKR